MTWILSRDDKIEGEWSDDIIETIATRIKKSKAGDTAAAAQIEEILNIIAEFLPNPVRDALLSK
jgi:hypothetical protein